MRRRDTERVHELADTVFSNINIFDLQGLLINRNREFSSAIEAFDLEAGEQFNLEIAFTEDELRAKLLLANQLNIPFYIITYSSGNTHFTINRIGNTALAIGVVETFHLTFPEFIKWWASLKGTIQTKELFEAQLRIERSSVDDILGSVDLSWGGNVDGFIVSTQNKNQILGIVEKRVSGIPINNYDPADYFNHRGGDFYTWLPLVNLANTLNVPLFLMTFNRDDSSRFGLAVVDNINDGLNYKGTSPKDNLYTNIQSAKVWMNQFMPQ